MKHHCTFQFKQIIRFILILLWISIGYSAFSQIKSMGFTKEVVTPVSDLFRTQFRPKIKTFGDTLFVATNSGIYMKSFKQDTEWKLYAFGGVPVTEFVKKGNQLLAISTGTKDGKDSLLLLSNDNGKTCIDFTSSHFLEYEYNYLSRLAQNPQNPASILVLHYNSGVSKSEDFGLTWKNINENCFEYQNWFLGFHPLDTTTLFYTGETGYFNGMIIKSPDGGATWSDYMHPGGDNCIHHIAFHPVSPDILIYSGENTIGKSTDKGETWSPVNLYDTGMFFFKVLFDPENPDYLYATGLNRGSLSNDMINVYRSADTGDTWHLAYQEKLDTDCGGVIDMIVHNNKLIFYTVKSGLFELDLGDMPSVSNTTIRSSNIYAADGNLYIETGQTSELVIYDMAGQLIVNQKVSAGIITLRLSKGLYIVNLDGESKKVRL